MCECDSNCYGVCVDSPTTSQQTIQTTIQPTSDVENEGCDGQVFRHKSHSSSLHAAELSLFMIGLLGLGAYLIDVNQNQEENNNWHEERQTINNEGYERRRQSN